MLRQTSSQHHHAPSSSFHRPTTSPRIRVANEYSYQPEPSSTSEMANSSRKRQRIGIDGRTPKLSSYDISGSIASLDAFSPAPLARSDYFLSGGLDTPGAWSEHRLERAEEQDAQQDYRQSRFTSQINSRETVPQRPVKNWSMTGTAWAFTGGLAGKFINFCLDTTFRGFRAGSGQEYTDYAQAVTEDSPGTSMHSGTIPGYYPSPSTSTDLRNEDMWFDDTRDRRVDRSGDRVDGSGAKNTWIFVEHSHRSDDSSPTRKKSRASYAGPSQIDTVGAFSPVRPYTASFASPRSRAASNTSTTRQHSATKRSRQSLASPQSRRTTLSATQQSPASPEIDLYHKKRRKEDKKQDESLRKLNAHLQDMIREGQQALGSRVEIIDEFSADERYFHRPELG